jgi:hypothetical protein
VSRSHGDRGDQANKLRALKKQVESLKRENSGLQKELRKANQRVAELLNFALEEEPDAPFKKGEGLTCTNPSCSKGVYAEHRYPVRGGEKVYLVCNLCKDRKPVKG